MSHYPSQQVADCTKEDASRTAGWVSATRSSRLREKWPREAYLETPRNRKALHACMNGMNRVIGLMRTSEQRRDKAAISAIQEQCEECCVQWRILGCCAVSVWGCVCCLLREGM